MSKCSNCNEKIGFLKTKHKLIDANGNEVYYCSQCYKEWETENKRKLEKEKLDQEKQNRIILSEYCSRYLQNKDNSFKAIVSGIYKNSDLLDVIRQNDLESLKNFFSELLNNGDNSTVESSSCVIAIQFLEDLKTIKRKMQSNNVRASYFQIFQIITELADKDVNNIYNDIISRLYSSISQITKTDKKKIIEEYIKLNTDNTNNDVNLMMLKMLFNKFEFEYSDSEIQMLLIECLGKSD